MFPDVYKQFFRAYPISQLDASEEKRRAGNFGGKIYLPPSALAKLTTMRISYPMLFEIRPGDTRATRSSVVTANTPPAKRSHAGVLEFVAPEGRVYLPEWMMTTLGLRSGALVDVRSTSLELGSFVRLEPQHVDFLDISDPRAVLENSLRNFSALTQGDVFQINYNDSLYEIRVLEVKPETDRNAISVVETDLSVDFAPPVGYVDPSMNKKARTSQHAGFGATGTTGGSALGGSGRPQTEAARAYQAVAAQRTGTQGGMRLNGRQDAVEVQPVDVSIYEDRDAPALDLPEGQLFFGFPVVPLTEPEGEQRPSPFAGSGQSLRKPKA